MSKQLSMRGPNYDWKLEAEHLQQKLETTRALLHKIDSSSERLVYELEVKLALAKESLQEIAGETEDKGVISKAREALEKLK